MIRLLLARHGATVWNAAGRYQGHTDVPLSPRGTQQAEALAGVLATETIQAVYASDLCRARDTAQMVARRLGVTVQPVAQWREIAFGAWEGLTFTEVQQRDARAMAAWQADPLHTAPPGGETLQQVADRIDVALTALVAAQRGHTVTLVAHGGTLRILLCLVLGLSPAAYRRFVLAPAALAELYLHGPDSALIRWNDTQHLTDGLRDL
jgi:broad specificity phosphatase PhoE